MSLPKELITVTPLSKFLALTLFITLPILAFIFGIKYESNLNQSNQTISNILPTSENTLQPTFTISNKAVDPNKTLIAPVLDILKNGQMIIYNLSYSDFKQYHNELNSKLVMPFIDYYTGGGQEKEIRKLL